MKFRTIWTIPAMSFAERCRRTRDSLAMNLAYRLPKRLRYWAMIHSINYVAVKTNAVMGEITVDQLMRNMDRPKGMR